MNILRYEQEIRKDADKMHKHAQDTGIPQAYIAAAQLYEKCGDFDVAAVCREAAERLQSV